MFKFKKNILDPALRPVLDGIAAADAVPDITQRLKRYAELKEETLKVTDKIWLRQGGALLAGLALCMTAVLAAPAMGLAAAWGLGLLGAGITVKKLANAERVVDDRLAIRSQITALAATAAEEHFKEKGVSPDVVKGLAEVFRVNANFPAAEQESMETYAERFPKIVARVKPATA